MDVSEQNEYLKKQKTEWNSVAPAWKKWDGWLDASMKPCNDRILELSLVASGKKILDLGCGTGHPAIPVAIAAGEEGMVVGLDLSEDMLEVARQKAAALQLTNISFELSDLSTIPFEESSFDCLTSRFCFMFLAEVEKTLRESQRVLIPGGRFAAAVWGLKEKNPAFSIPMGLLKNFMDIPTPPPGQPGIFSLSAPGDLAEKARSAGFSNVREETFPVTWSYASSQEYLDGFRDLAAPFKPLIDRLLPDELKEFKKSIHKEINTFRVGGGIRLEAETVIVSGEK